MMKRFSLLGGWTLLTLLTLLAGCDPNKSGNAGGEAKPAETTPQPTQTAAAPDAPKFKVITNGVAPFWETMGKGLEAGKNEIKVNADWQGPQKADHNAQVTLMREALATKVDGIAVSPIEANALAPIIDEIVSGGTPVITFDSDAPTSKRMVYLGTNNYEAGKALGNEAAKLYPNGAKLVAFVGNMSAQNARDRFQGFEDAVKGKNITFLQAPYEDNKDVARAQSNVEDAISKYGDKINGLVGLYSYNGPAIIQAVKKQSIRDKVKILLFDGDAYTLKGLEENMVDVTVVQKPYEFGRLSVMLLNEIKKSKGDVTAALKAMQAEFDRQQMKVNGNVVDTGVTVVTPTNAPAFLKELKEKGIEST